MMTLMEGMFRLAVSLSLAGGFATLLVLGAKALARDRVGPGWGYYIWMLPLALYLVPVKLPRWGMAAAQADEIRAAIPAAAGAVTSAAAGQAPAAAPALWDGAAAFWDQALPVLAWIWALGVLFTAALRLADHRRIAASLGRCCAPPAENGRAQKRFQKALAEQGIPAGRVELVICPGVESPLLIGLWRPRVVLPREDYPDARLDMMFRHELGHYRGHDLWYKAAALGAACLHWFNPLAWWLVRDLDRCCELWCDRRATGGMTPRERKQYGRMLLDVVQDGGASPAGTAPLAMRKEELKHRLTLLGKVKSATLLERAAAGALALTVTAAGVAWAGAVNPGPLFRAETSAPAWTETGRRETVPELWGEAGEQPETAPQPDPQEETPRLPFQMQVVLGGQAQAAQQPPAEDPAPAAEDTPEEDKIPLEDIPAGNEEDLPEPEPESDHSNLEDVKYEYSLTEEEEDSLSWDGSLIWPVDGGYISYGYGDYYGHTGVDIMADPGTEIYAAADGIVGYATGYSIWPYGKRVDIQHGDGVVTRYAHCSQVLVQPGEEVKQGQLIALVGRTGNATGWHCHFEVRRDGDVLDPENYIGSSYPRTAE